MKFLKKLIVKWVNDARDEERDVAVVQAVGRKGASVDDIDADCYTLRVYPARGGRVVQYHKYDRQNDRTRTSLYVISDNEDLGDAVKNIVVEQALQGN
jgi:hypothetical protein